MMQYFSLIHRRVTKGCQASPQDEFSFPGLKAFQQRAWHRDLEELALVNCISSITVRCLTVLCPLNCYTISFLYFSMWWNIFIMHHIVLVQSLPLCSVFYIPEWTLPNVNKENKQTKHPFILCPFSFN